MRIALNGLCADNRSGTGYYTWGLLSGLTGLSEQSELNDHFLAFLSDSPLFKGGRGDRSWTLETIPVRHPVARIAWEEFVLPRRARRWGADLLHGPAFMLPSGWRGPAIVTIHDCAFLRYPETILPLKRAWYRYAIPRSARRANLILTDSEAARRDIIELMKIPGDKVRAIPLGVDPRFYRENIPDEIIAQVRKKHGLPDCYILFVGVIEPRKNLVTLLRAFDQARGKGLKENLVLAGRPGWGMDLNSLLMETPEIRDAVHVLGFVEDAEMPALYAGASVFAYPSLYEGFGLPVLEAMAAGTPVIVSDDAALVELAGEAGFVLPARDAEAWGDCLLRMTSDSGILKLHREQGLARAAHFTWENTAHLTLMAYHDAVIA